MQHFLLIYSLRRRDNLRIFNNSRIKCIISNILRGSNLRGSGLKDNDLRDNKHRDSGLRDSDLKDSGLKGNDLKGNDKRLKKILSNIRPLQSKKLIKGVKKADALVKSYSHCSALWSSYSLYIQ